MRKLDAIVAAVKRESSDQLRLAVLMMLLVLIWALGLSIGYPIGMRNIDERKPSSSTGSQHTRTHFVGRSGYRRPGTKTRKPSSSHRSTKPSEQEGLGLLRRLEREPATSEPPSKSTAQPLYLNGTSVGPATV